MYFVYIIQSDRTGRYYVGYIGNLEDRIRHHNSGLNISTKPGIPWKVVYAEKFENKKDAWLREHKIKSYKGGEAFEKLIGGVA